MKKNKRLALGFGMLTTVITPVVVAISCDEESPTKKPVDDSPAPVDDSPVLTPAPFVFTNDLAFFNDVSSSKTQANLITAINSANGVITPNVLGITEPTLTSGVIATYAITTPLNDQTGVVTVSVTLTKGTETAIKDITIGFKTLAEEANTNINHVVSDINIISSTAQSNEPIQAITTYEHFGPIEALKYNITLPDLKGTTLSYIHSELLNDGELTLTIKVELEHGITQLGTINVAITIIYISETQRKYNAAVLIIEGFLSDIKTKGIFGVNKQEFKLAILNIKSNPILRNIIEDKTDFDIVDFFDDNITIDKLFVIIQNVRDNGIRNISDDDLTTINHVIDKLASPDKSKNFKDTIGFINKAFKTNLNDLLTSDKTILNQFLPANTATSSLDILSLIQKVLFEGFNNPSESSDPLIVVKEMSDYIYNQIIAANVITEDVVPQEAKDQGVDLPEIKELVKNLIHYLLANLVGSVSEIESQSSDSDMINNEFFKGKGLLELNEEDFKNLIISISALFVNFPSIVDQAIDYAFANTDIDYGGNLLWNFGAGVAAPIIIKSKVGELILNDSKNNGYLKIFDTIDPTDFANTLYKLVNQNISAINIDDVKLVLKFIEKIKPSWSYNLSDETITFLLKFFNEGIDMTQDDHSAERRSMAELIKGIYKIDVTDEQLMYIIK
ncbi:lipoprotein 17-related variable surface protein [Candidatus Mycoplasma mahonii]|uniref:lipoprotein 17-related variable surface protein n=1 Tax=Candidatus Mycoplasma mahonii TaxID=3004105 RepID=UPI0026F0B534|nr:lipoprotein 17-related variable surface protein [Candidatus Mycoplasma mahonii]WKX02778.1 hypothetical protein O3I44_01750 [Candidatus Mycoplasma mahonii]